jgi:hypothetical protein
MSHGFGHPPEWDHRLPVTNAMLAPLLPPPNKDPSIPHYVGSQSLAQYKSPRPSERLPQGHRQSGLNARNLVAHPSGRQAHDRDRITHSGVVDHRITIPRHSYSHDAREAQEVALAHSPCPLFGPGGNYPLDGDSRLQSTHSPHDDKVQGKAPSTTPVEQSNRPNTATGVPSDSPWGLTKAGKARKRLEQACVSCRKKKTKCEPMSSGSKCLPCEKSGSECYFDNA